MSYPSGIRPDCRRRGSRQYVLWDLSLSYPSRIGGIVPRRRDVTWGWEELWRQHQFCV